MRTLAVLLLCFFSVLAFTDAQNCASFKESCAKCMIAGCNYVWTASGFYNSSTNGACLTKAEFDSRRFANSRNKTIWAYALPETGPNAVNSTLGRYLMGKPDSSKNYLALAIPCFDRQLCYCKPMPPPPPSRLIIIVRDSKTNELISLAGLNTTVENGTFIVTDKNGKVIFDSIHPTDSGYFANACAEGYKCNFTVTPSIGVNMTITVTIFLEPLPCILTVQTVLDSDGSILSGVTVKNTVPGLPDKVTGDNGTLTYTLDSVPASGAVNGFLSGYLSVGPKSFSCNLGGNPKVVIRLTPILNTVIVTVLDARTFEFITSALVTLTVTSFSETGVDAQATTTFSPVSAGNYVANGRAAGYSSNSTVVPKLTTNTTVHVYIYLTQLPCNLKVLVLTSQNTSKVLSGAAVNLNGGAGFSRLSDTNGVVNYILPYNNATLAFGSKSNYGSNSTSFSCGKGENVTVIIYLPEVLTIVFAAVDIKSPGNPYILNAVIRWNGEIIPPSAEDSRYHYKEVASLPLTGDVLATAPGFNDQQDNGVKFALDKRNYTISLAPQEFTLFFTPVELILSNGVSVERRIETPGFLPNNYFELNPSDSLASVIYVPKPIQIGGSVSRNTNPVTSAAYSADVTISFFDFTTVTVVASKFDNVSPPPLDTFTVLPTDISSFKPNWSPANITAQNDVLIYVPPFAATPERNLLINYPYQLYSGYLVVRVTVVQADLKTAAPFSENDFVAATVTFARNSQFTNYNNKQLAISGKFKAIFEFPVAFQSAINKIEIAAPLQSYNLTASNFADPNNPSVPLATKSGTVYNNLLTFTFNRASSIMSVDKKTGQVVRDPTKALFEIRDWVLVQLPPNKKRSD